MGNEIKFLGIYKDENRSPFYFAIYERDGKRSKISLKTANKADAVSRWHEHYEKLSRPLVQKYRIPKGVPIGAFAKQYFASIEKKRKAAGFRSAIQRVNYFVNWVRKKSILDVTKEVVEEYHEFLIEGRAEKTVNEYISALNVFFDYCVDKKIVSENPVDTEKLWLKPRRPQIVICQPEEVDRYKSACNELSLQERAFFYILLCCGLRESEARGLARTSFFLEKFELKVSGSRTRFDKKITEKGKTVNAIRTVPILPPAEVAIAEYLASCTEEYPFQIPEERVQRRFRWLSEKVGIRLDNWVTRHTFASMLISTGLVTIKQLQAIMGHAYAVTSLDTYGALYNPTPTTELRKRLMGPQ